jgi:hypothetical protein
MRCQYPGCIYFKREGDLFRCYHPDNVFDLYYGKAFKSNPMDKDWEDTCSGFVPKGKKRDDD